MLLAISTVYHVPVEDAADPTSLCRLVALEVLPPLSVTMTFSPGAKVVLFTVAL